MARVITKPAPAEQSTLTNLRTIRLYSCPRAQPRPATGDQRQRAPIVVGSSLHGEQGSLCAPARSPCGSAPDPPRRSAPRRSRAHIAWPLQRTLVPRDGPPRRGEVAPAHRLGCGDQFSRPHNPGVPHIPAGQPPRAGAAAALRPPLECAANVDNSRSTSVVLHWGQCGPPVSEVRTSFSKRVPQSLQRYSKIGIGNYSRTVSTSLSMKPRMAALPALALLTMIENAKGAAPGRSI